MHAAAIVNGTRTPYGLRPHSPELGGMGLGPALARGFGVSLARVFLLLQGTMGT